MRNIWFRGLGKNGIWRYGHYFVVNDVLQSYHYIRENSSDHRIDPTTLGQFTGLKDKNGIEIYESDVIMIDGNKKTLVSWSEKFASFCIKNDTWAFQHWFGEALDPSECEVIGNVHETPNLLK